MLPEYALATHFSYVAEFVESLADSIDIFLIVEKGTLPATSRVTRRYRSILRFAPFRVLETFFVLLYARLLGYRTHYVHYSFVAAIGSSIVTRLFGGRTFYWNCGMPWVYTRSAFREWYEQLTFRLVHYLVTGAAALAPGYARYYTIPETKIKIIPNWIDVESGPRPLTDEDRRIVRSELHIPADAPVILFVHRLAKRKGANLLPNILAGLSDQHAVLVVVGDGPERESLETCFRANGLWERVRMMGSVPQLEVVRYFSCADVFLLPSEEEGFPHVLTEAMLYGVPYVASEVGGVRDMTPPILHPYLVPYGDVDQYVARLDELISHDSLRREASEVLLEWVKQYDKPVIMERFLRLIRNET